MLTIHWQKPRQWAQRLMPRRGANHSERFELQKEPTATNLPSSLCKDVRSLMADRTPYLLVYTTSEALPAHREILEALQTLRKGFPCRIVVIGTMAHQWKTLLREERLSARRLRRRVVPLASLSLEELQVVVQNAFALLLSSQPNALSETVRASAACTTRLITTNTSENRKCYRGAAVYYDPADGQSIECALRRILTYNHAGESQPTAGNVVNREALAEESFCPALRPHQADAPLYFLHIPKAAGTSVRVMLEDQYHHGQICNSYYPTQLGAIPGSQLQQFQFFRGHLGSALYPLLEVPVNTITWMREPLDWLLSNYAFRIQEHLIPKTMTFSEWLEIAESDCVCHFLTAAMPPGEARSGSLISRAISVLRKCFLIGLVEQQEDSVNLLCHHLGLYPPEVTAALNRTQSRTRLSDYSAEVREQAEARVRADRVLYEWAQPLFLKQLQEMEQALQPEITARFGAGEPPTTEQVRTILRERFFRKQEAVALRDEIDYTFDQPLIGEGWYERQTLGPDSPFGCARWISGDTCRATLYLPIQQQRACQIRFGISEIFAPKAVAGLRLVVNGVPVPLERTSQGHPRLFSELVFQARIPVVALKRASHLTQLTFTTDAYLRPIDKDPFTRDLRKFTVALNWIAACSVR